MEIVLVGFHAVQSSHQTSIVAIEASAEVGTGEDKIEAEHALGPRGVFCAVNIVGQLDSDIGFWEGIVVGAHGLLLVDAMRHVDDWLVYGYVVKGQVTRDSSFEVDSEEIMVSFYTMKAKW